MNGFWPSIVTIATAIVGLAVVAVVLSKNSNTERVVGTAWSGFSGAITAATNPYSGGSGAGLTGVGDLNGVLHDLGARFI